MHGDDLAGSEQDQHVAFDQIRAIGHDPELIARTVNAAKKALVERKVALETEARRLQRELEQAHAALRQQLGPVPDNGRPRRGVPANQQPESLRSLEERLLAVEAGLTALRGQRIYPDELHAALEAFNPVWDHLTTPEKAHLLRGLIERIDYDGGSGKLAILFRPEGARLLGREGIPTGEVSQ